VTALERAGNTCSFRRTLVRLKPTASASVGTAIAGFRRTLVRLKLDDLAAEVVFVARFRRTLVRLKPIGSLEPLLRVLVSDELS